MRKEKNELSSRFYAAEISVWIISGVLILFSIGVIDAKQTIPFLKVGLEESRYFPHVLSVIDGVCFFYLYIEFKQSGRTDFISYLRFAVAGSIGLMAIIMSYPDLIVGTTYEGVSIGWFAGFVAIGRCLGIWVSMFIFSSLMIRDGEEAKQLNLPRVPTGIKTLYLLLAPSFIILMSIYYLVQHHSPPILTVPGVIITSLILIYSISGNMYRLYTHHGKKGNKTFPTRKHIKEKREILSMDDYRHQIHARTNIEIDKTKYGPSVFGSTIQKKAKDMVDNHDSQMMKLKNFHVVQLDQIRLKPKPKDGNKANRDLANLTFEIISEPAGATTFHVLFNWEDSPEKKYELELSNEDVVAYVELLIEEMIASNGIPEKGELDPMKLIIKAIHEVALESLLPKQPDSLHFASSGGNLSQVSKIISAGNNVNEVSNGGYTPLLLATAQGHKDVVEILLKSGANPTHVNLMKRTPLFFASRYGRIDLCKLLIEYGAEVDTYDAYNHTPLLEAVLLNNLDIVNYLISHGANVNVVTSSGMSAVDIAQKNQNGEIAKILRASLKTATC